MPKERILNKLFFFEDLSVVSSQLRTKASSEIAYFLFLHLCSHTRLHVAGK